MQGLGNKARELKMPYRPVVKFRDVDTDLLRSIAVAEGDPQDADPAHDDESNSTDSDEDAEEGNGAAGFAFEPEGTDWLTDEEVSLESLLLLDLLSVNPVGVSQRGPTAPQKEAQVTRTQPNWDF